MTPISTMQGNPLDARIPARQIAEELSVDATTVRRWSTNGIRGIRLRGTQIGGRRYVDRRDLDEFLAACAAAAGVDSPAAT